MREPDLEPSPELSYILGARYGDGSVSDKVVSLETKDKEFAEEFVNALNSVLSRKLNTHIYKRGYYTAKAGSKVLCEYLQLPLEEQATQIMYYPAQFVRGFFDSEASATRYLIIVRCSDKALLCFVKSLLPLFDIISTEVKLLNWSVKRLGKPVSLGVRYGMRVIIPKKVLYGFSIYGRSNLLKFIKEIGFTIYRKNRHFEYLEDYW